MENIVFGIPGRRGRRGEQGERSKPTRKELLEVIIEHFGELPDLTTVVKACLEHIPSQERIIHECLGRLPSKEALLEDLVRHIPDPDSIAQRVATSEVLAEKVRESLPTAHQILEAWKANPEIQEYLDYKIEPLRTRLMEDIVPQLPKLEDIIVFIPTKEELTQGLPTREELLQELPTKEDLLSLVPTKEELLQSLPTKEDLLSLVPTKEDLLRELPTKEELIREVLKFIPVHLDFFIKIYDLRTFISEEPVEVMPPQLIVQRNTHSSEPKVHARQNGTRFEVIVSTELEITRLTMTVFGLGPKVEPVSVTSQRLPIVSLSFESKTHMDRYLYPGAIISFSVNLAITSPS